MSRPVAIVLAIVLALGAVEALAYGWMHPAPSGLNQPVLCYRPSRNAGVPPASDESYSTWNKNHAEEKANIEHRTSNIQRPTADKGPASTNSSTDNRPPTTRLSSPRSTDNSSSYTPLPEVVAQSLPKLHCSSGTAARIELDNGASAFVAFFEWDLADTGNVLEAYKHLPKVCMGSIGMTLINHLPARSYQIDGQTLAFDHTVFHDPRGMIIHAFKGTWVSGANSLLGNGHRGGLEQERLLRWKAALHRFRPAHASVAQGAVRGATTPDLAWQAFKDTMLVDLSFESYPKEGRTPIRPAHDPMIQAP